MEFQYGQIIYWKCSLMSNILVAINTSNFCNETCRKINIQIGTWERGTKWSDGDSAETTLSLVTVCERSSWQNFCVKMVGFFFPFITKVNLNQAEGPDLIGTHMIPKLQLALCKWEGYMYRSKFKNDFSVSQRYVWRHLINLKSSFPYQGNCKTKMYEEAFFLYFIHSKQFSQQESGKLKANCLFNIF